MAQTTATPQPIAEDSRHAGFTPRAVLIAGLPLLLLAGLLLLIVQTDAGLGERAAPPIEALSIQRVRLPEPGLIELRVVNDGPDPITIAQVLVDEAYWQYSMEPAGPLGRLASATITIPYPWVEEDAHEIALLTSNGEVFEAEIPVAIESPHANREGFWRLGLIGFYVGIVPVTLGLLWYPSMRRLGRRGMNFILAVTVGLLVFLVVDMFEAARDVALTVPGSFDAPVLVPILAILTTALLITVGRSLRNRGRETGGLPLASQISVGIGLHNLGEGLAIGAAFALGEVALGVFLIVGFTLHNVTEGIGIAAPLVRERPRLAHFAALAAIAGGPAILGTWIGAFVYSPLWTTIFLAIGVGALLQVVVEVGRLIQRSQERHGQPALTWTTLGGATAGIAVMYLTALLVTA